MANSREVRFQQDNIDAMTAHGWKAGTAGYDRKVEEIIDVSELELTHYRLSKREERRLRLEDAEGGYGLTPVSKVGTGKPHVPEKQHLAEIIDRLNDLYGAESWCYSRASDTRSITHGGHYDHFAFSGLLSGKYRHTSPTLSLYVSSVGYSLTQSFRGYEAVHWQYTHQLRMLSPTFANLLIPKNCTFRSITVAFP